MQGVLSTLCVLLLAVAAYGRPHGRKHGLGGDLVCEKTTILSTELRECRWGECTLGPLSYVNRDGAEVTLKFCDGKTEDGTSLVARKACKVTDLNGNVLLEKMDSEEDECTLELAITYENASAVAFFPNRTAEGRRKDSSEEESNEVSGEDISEESSEESREKSSNSKKGRKGRGRKSRSVEDENEDSIEESGEEDNKSWRGGKKHKGQGGRGNGRSSGRGRDRSSESQESEEDVVTEQTPPEA